MASNNMTIIQHAVNNVSHVVRTEENQESLRTLSGVSSKRMKLFEAAQYDAHYGAIELRGFGHLLKITEEKFIAHGKIPPKALTDYIKTKGDEKQKQLDTILKLGKKAGVKFVTTTVLKKDTLLRQANYDKGKLGYLTLKQEQDDVDNKQCERYSDLHATLVEVAGLIACGFNYWLDLDKENGVGLVKFKDSSGHIEVVKSVRYKLYRSVKSNNNKSGALHETESALMCTMQAFEEHQHEVPVIQRMDEDNLGACSSLTDIRGTDGTNTSNV